MSELWKYLQNIVSTCNEAITFSGNITNILNRWLVKTQDAKGDEANHEEPVLIPTGRILEKHELNFLSQEEVEHNWKWYVPNDWNRFLCEYNSIQRDVKLDKDKYIYAVAAVYCTNEQESMIFCNSMTPFSMWINGQLVHTSNYDFFVRERHFVYNFKQGVNIVLIEKPYFLRHNALKILHDEFVVTIKPYDYCANPKENRYYDIELFNKLKYMYSIVLNKSVYEENEMIEAIVMPQYFEQSSVEDNITLSVFDTTGKLLISVITKTTRKAQLPIHHSYRGVVKITATMKDKNCEILDIYAVIGDFHSLVEAVAMKARSRSDCNQEVLLDLEQLATVPNTKIGLMTCSNEMMPSYLYQIIFEKLYEFIQYEQHPEASVIKKPYDIYDHFIPAYYKTGIDDNDLLYYVLLPKQYDVTKSYPMFLYIEHGIGISRFPTLKDYQLQQDYGDAILVHTCGRGILNRDYIHEANVIGIINTVVQDYSIDRDRIYLIGTCNGAKKGYGLAIKNPGLFAAIFNINGTIRTDLVNPDYDIIHNLDTIPINHIFNVEEEAFNGARVAEAFSHVKGIKVWPSSYYSHDDFNDSQNSNLLIKELLRQDRNKYPKHIHFTTYDAMFNRCNWVHIDQMLDLSCKSMVDATICSYDQIIIEGQNLSRISLLLNKEEMKLQEKIVIQVDSVKLPITLDDYTRVIVKWTNAGIEVKQIELTKELYFALFDAIKVEDRLMGLKQIYYDKCYILAATSYQAKKNIRIKKLLKLLSSPLREKNKNYCYEKYVEDELDQEKLSNNNFLLLASLENPSKLQKTLCDQVNCVITEEELTYGGVTYRGDSFILAKCPNPYNNEKNALLVAYNNENVEQQLIDLWNTFDTNGIFYADAIIFNNGSYYTYRNE